MGFGLVLICMLSLGMGAICAALLIWFVWVCLRGFVTVELLVFGFVYDWCGYCLL